MEKEITLSLPYIAAELKSWYSGIILDEDDVWLLKQAAELIEEHHLFCELLEKKANRNVCD